MMHRVKGKKIPQNTLGIIVHITYDSIYIPKVHYMLK